MSGLDGKADTDLPCADAEDRDAHITVEVLNGGAEVIDSLEEEWRRICEDGPSDLPFHRPEWSRAFTSHFAANQEAVVLAARGHGGRLLAVLPLMREKKWLVPGLLAVWKLRGMSLPDAWPTDLVVASRQEAAKAAAAIWARLGELPRWHILELPNIREGGDAERLVRTAEAAGCRVFRRPYMRTPHLSLEGWDGQDAFRLARSKNLRHTLKRIRNKAGQNSIALRRVEVASDGLDQFFALERRSWKGRAKRTVGGAGRLRGFYTDIAQAAERFGYLSVYFLDLRGEAIASRIALTYRGHYAEMECVHDEAYSDYAPGHLIIAEILSDCARRGFRDVDLSGHSQEYKERWTAEFRWHSYWYVFRQGTIGGLLHLAMTRIKPVFQLARSVVGRVASRTDRSNSNKTAGAE